MSTQPVVPSVVLYNQQGSSDKVYQAAVAQDGEELYSVTFAFGRRGSTLVPRTKVKAVPLETAISTFQKLVAKKKSEGYRESGAAAQELTSGDGRSTGVLPQLLNSVDHSTAADYLHNENWCFQIKEDGKRLLVRGDSTRVFAINRKGLEVAGPTELLGKCGTAPRGYILDGESIGSRYVAFDMQEFDGCNLRILPYSARLGLMAAFCDARQIEYSQTAISAGDKKEMWRLAVLNRLEGLVIKRLDAPYREGRPNNGGDQLKLKFWASATCQVMALNDSRSVSLAVHKRNALHRIGNVTIPPNYDIPHVGALVEIKYLYCYRDGSLYQPQYLGQRQDKDFADEHSSLKFKAGEEDD